MSPSVYTGSIKRRLLSLFEHCPAPLQHDNTTTTRSNNRQVLLVPDVSHETAPRSNVENLPDPASTIVDTLAAPPAMADGGSNSADAIISTQAQAATADQDADPVRKVLNTTELLETICSHLPMKTLTRARRVSKSWKDVIHGSIKLRRTLFLQSEEPEYHFEWLKNGPYHYKGERTMWLPTLPTKANKNSQLVVKPHPILKPDSGYSTYLRFEELHVSWLKVSTPDAFVTQPPVPKVKIRHGYRGYSVVREKGVTFGAVREQLEMLRCELCDYWLKANGDKKPSLSEDTEIAYCNKHCVIIKCPQAIPRTSRHVQGLIQDVTEESEDFRGNNRWCRMLPTDHNYDR